jgi:hypothetical protein
MHTLLVILGCALGFVVLIFIAIGAYVSYDMINEHHRRSQPPEENKEQRR